MNTNQKNAIQYLKLMNDALDVYSKSTIVNVAILCQYPENIPKIQLMVEKKISEEEMIKTLEEMKVPKK